MKVQKSVRAIAASIFVLAVGTLLHAGMATDGDRHAPTLVYKVTIQNIAETQPMSPPVAATHKQPVGMFSVGDKASPGLEAIAEDGNQLPMFMRFNNLPQATQAVDIARPLTPSGQVVGDFTDAATFRIKSRPSDRLSLATMLICTNDGFTGLDRAKLPVKGSHVYLTSGYDAGTEDNTELSMDIVDACSALGPVGLEGDPNGNLNDPVDTMPREPIQHHRGVVEIGDLLADHDWSNPVAKVTVTRIAQNADRFLAPLNGVGEVPIVDTAAAGTARFRLAGNSAGVDGLHFTLDVFGITGVVQAHIHRGLPSENGPVVAFLFGPSDPPTGMTDGPLAEGTIEESDLLGPFEDDLAGFLSALRDGDLYVNVHTTDNPGGEIRGQIGVANGVGARRAVFRWMPKGRRN